MVEVRSRPIPTAVADRYGEAIEAELGRWLSTRPETGRHYKMLAYHMGWTDESLQERPGPRGKRFRPLLCLMSCEAVGGDWQSALPFAAAVEFLHNFSLIHDDIEDHDESRHHRPALWKLWGDPMAINAGDAMLALAGLAALSAPPQPDIPRGFQETALALTEGQHLDMSFEDRSSVSIEEYFHMIGLKTAALIGLSCEAGARIGLGSATDIKALQEFGRHFGLAYQVFDDVKGIWAPLEETGKTAGKDILNHKKSLPVLLALDRVVGRDLEMLSDYYERRREVDPVLITQIIDASGVRADVETDLAKHLGQAFQALESADLQQARTEELRHLAASLVQLDADAGDEPGHQA